MHLGQRTHRDTITTEKSALQLAYAGSSGPSLGKRLDNLWIDPPIPYRKQNGGDYEIPALTLKPGLEKQGPDRNLQGSFRLHKRPVLA